ncbi:homoserine dehydrogenase [Methylacidimicrobium cyclopophantes]|uniref:Homoserine dehydrogenase n=1 Tax=Methylacidimicrobium cyclopophantes TaxID=1041766 RepID=A0A5E6M7T1_9BACT|nr:homoserine dehydrogenase [Methylacidimicrobium cyclopophantes]VVM04439.1 homoserine dehydrogenase [Methylacidimicrobium cyclopophantes]
MNTLHIGLVGLGTVGASVWKNLRTQEELLARRCGKLIRIERVAEKNRERARLVGVPESQIVDDWRMLACDPSLDVVIELIGGTEIAADVIWESLSHGKDVVTANKALLAERGQELAAFAAERGKRLLFEASVAGGIPLLLALREGLIANEILSLHGIINGTCNYLLSAMASRGIAYQEALREAKELGYAEADETLDVAGHDSAHKAVILSALAYGFWPPLSEVHTEGIQKIDPLDLHFAQELGYTLKLLAILRSHPKSREIEVRVHPTLLRKGHLLSSVNGVFNAIAVRGDIVGETLFYGRGAGGDPTSSAVLSDLASLARGPLPIPDIPSPAERESRFSLRPMAKILSRYYVRFLVEDRPGVLAEIARVFATRKISISSVIQPEGHRGETVPLIVLLHRSRESDVQEACRIIETLPAVKKPAILLRVEDLDGEDERSS